MKSYFFIILSFISLNKIFADYIDLDISNKIINFSTCCKDGRISIFEISTPGCPPCESLKKYLVAKNYDMSKVDIFHCLIDYGAAKEAWGFCEGITNVPVVYIYGPNRNPVKILHPSDKDFSPETINNVIVSLLNIIPIYYRVNLTTPVNITGSSLLEMPKKKLAAKAIKPQYASLVDSLITCVKNSNLKRDSISMEADSLKGEVSRYKSKITLMKQFLNNQ